jgi:septum formation protein
MMAPDSRENTVSGSGPFRGILPLVLASASPRRRDFLRLLGPDFEIVPPEGDEPRPVRGENPAAYAMRAAEAKARSVAAKRPDALVLGADTVVALADDILGKPDIREDALRMLRMLAGKTHEVISACCCLSPGGGMRKIRGGARVRFFPWPEEVLACYAATGEPSDKAGAYAVQGMGAFLAESVEGSASAVAGLPLAELTALLLELGAITPAPPNREPSRIGFPGMEKRPGEKPSWKNRF